MANNEKIETITPLEAAQKLGMNAEGVRAGLRQKIFPFGFAVQGKTGRWTYKIIKSKFLKFIDEEEKTNEEYS